MMRIAILLLLFLFSFKLYAGCSPHMGLASINEISKDHNWLDDDTDFIEVKKLDQQLSNSLLDSWTLEICDYFLIFFPTCSGAVSLSSLQKMGKYWIYEGDPAPASYINWNGGFDVVLKDENGDVVDYVSSNGVDLQEESCSYPFDTDLTSGSSTRRAKRKPDGSGDWEVPPGNSESETPGESNDDYAPPGDAPDLSFKEDIQVTQGLDATFTLQLSETYGSDVVINYETINGSGTAGTHYTSVAGSATIASGSLSVTIDVPTLISGDTNTQTFYFIITAATNANVVDQLAIGTILGYSGADHFSIVHSGSAANCEAESVVLQAKDAAGNIITSYTGTVTLATSTNNGDWTLILGGGAFSAGPADSGSASIEFISSDSGQVELGLTNTHSEVISINVSDGNGITESSNSASPVDDPDLTFLKSVFKFIYGDGTPPATETIANQISGKPFSSGLGYEPLKVRAITTDLETGQCVGLFNGSVPVELAIECHEPAVCASQSGSEFISGTTIIPENALGSVSSYVNKSILFSSDSTADLSAIYRDAGRIKLHARYQQTGDDVIGSSQNIDFIPAGFCIQTTDADSDCPGPTYENCSVFKKAGELFNLTVSAQGWISDGDSDFCDNNFLTPSFSGDVDLTPTLMAPSGGNLGTTNISTANLSAGTFSGNQYWTEVGVLAFQSGGNNYLSSVLPTNTSANFGRFTPFEFYITNHDDGTYTNGQTGFTYVGQTDLSGDGVIQYGTQPWIDFISRDANGNTIQNYLTGGFFKNPDGVYSVSTAILGNDGTTPLAITSVFDVPTYTYDAATYTYRLTLSANDHYLFNRDANALVAPFINDIQISLDSLTDDDGIAASNSILLSPTGGAVRYGRMNIINTYGPETEALNQSWQAQYYDGNDFLLNLLDVDTTIDSSNVVGGSIVVTDTGDSANPLQAGDSTLSGALALNQGQGELTWSTPVSNRYGSFDFEYDAPTWLEYDWTGSGNEDPTASVSFGRYRGHDKVIYWKEITY